MTDLEASQFVEVIKRMADVLKEQGLADGVTKLEDMNQAAFGMALGNASMFGNRLGIDVSKHEYYYNCVNCIIKDVRKRKEAQLADEFHKQKLAANAARYEALQAAEIAL